MMTRSETQEKLYALRQSLEAPFARAKKANDRPEMDRLQGIAGEIDDLLDQIAITALAQLAIRLGTIAARIGGSGAAAKQPLGQLLELSPDELNDLVAEILGQTSEEAPDLAEARIKQPNSDEEIPSGSESSVIITAPDPASSIDSGNLILAEAHLIALWKRSLFPIDDRYIIVFGLRGCRPVDYSGTGFASSHEIVVTPVNYRTMNCTIGQWRPSAGFSVFPGSTVPYGAIVTSHVGQGGSDVNQLGRGRYTRYLAGWHKRSEGSSGHWALQQDCPITLQRTGDDSDYDLLDRWEVGRIAGDNIHCAFHMGPDGKIPDSRYSSAGCQTVAGTVVKGARGSERGPWKAFIAPFANSLGTQKGTEYVLFDALEAQQMIRNRYKDKSVILRIGSQGQLVERLQSALNSRLNLTLDVNGEFGVSTFQAVIDFQRKMFGDNADDGIVGLETAEELGFSLPLFDFDDAISGGPGYREPSPSVATTLSNDQPTSIVTASVISPETKLAWGAVTKRKHGPTFNNRVIEISKRIKCDANHLMAVMAFESGESFAPDRQNDAGSGAVGLIQFMPSTARSLGTTAEKLATMTAIQQLDYVEQYFTAASRNGSFSTLGDLYMAVLWPAAVGKPDSYVLFEQGTTAYDQNRGLDINKNGRITKAEATSIVYKKFVLGLSDRRVG
ncbi:peptidoglycan-binding protein [Rhizobium ruizarguesonis]|uniref:peptidoglycan-binding protein n=1 Tax=Rhizobium ruizarguesonis TaxID=2081791 RepID=UPI0018D502B3|nr:peptidoglycan-binding protein [Rhizobium ruizarguesonis]